MAKVTVMILVYGVEDYIERCVRTLFEQTMSDLDFLFIDDCTPDRSIEVLQNVLEDYPNRKDQVRIIRLEKNSGQAVGRNLALEEVNTEYCIFCDSDDSVKLDMYENLYTKAEETGADMVFCDKFFVFDNKTEIRATYYNKDVCDPDEILLNYHKHWFRVSPTDKLIKTSIFRDNNIKAIEGANFGEDMLLVILALACSSKVAYVREPLYYYNKSREGSISAYLGKDEKITSQLICCDEICRFLREKDAKKYDRTINFLYFFHLKPILDRGRYKEWRGLHPETHRDIMSFSIYEFKLRVLYKLASWGFYLPLKMRKSHKKYKRDRSKSR